MDEHQTMFSHWTKITKTCYEHNMICEGCPNNTNFLCKKEPWVRNPYGIKNIKYAVIRTLNNIGEPKKEMKICDCKKHLEFDHTIDKELPFGYIESIAIFKCTVCGKEFTEEEVIRL